MNARKVLAVAVVVPLVAGVTTASAAAPKKKKKAPVRKPVCKIIPDVANDATKVGNNNGGPNDPNLDILSADIATSATMLTAVIRLVDLTDPGDARDSSQLGRAYDVAFNVGEAHFQFRALVSAQGNKWPGSGGTVDTTANEVRFHIPLSSISAPIKPNMKITALEANTARWVLQTDAVIGKADEAYTSTSYVATWPSCVRVGF